MFRVAVKLSRSTAGLTSITRTSGLTTTISRAPPVRFLHDETSINGPNSSPVVLQMINYALTHARSQKSGDSYGQGLLVLEQCVSSQPSEGQCAETWRGIALLAMSTLLYERGNFSEAIEKLQRVDKLKQASLEVRVAALEALAGLHLQLGEDDTSSVVADKCLELARKYAPSSGGGDYAVVDARANALKGLAEIVQGNVEAAESYFKDFRDNESCNGSAALSYGEYLHATRNFSLAKMFYQKVIEVLADKKDFSNLNALGSSNMTLDEVSLAANFALGQLEAHVGNFAEAEEILTRALTKTEELHGSNHPKVGVVLTCLALMFRNKASKEHCSAILIQEGLYRRALDFLKAPPVDSEDEEMKIDRRDIVALARGGYAETLCIQQNRKAEGEKMKKWAEAAWRNPRMSLAEALNYSGSSGRVLVIDGRISRAI